MTSIRSPGQLYTGIIPPCRLRITGRFFRRAWKMPPLSTTEIQIQSPSWPYQKPEEEASDKFSRLSPEQFPLYLIGHLQSNKVGKIDSRFMAVHSIDSVKLARRLSRHRESIQHPLEILLQVNTSGEISKSGFSEMEVLKDAAAEISALPYLKLQGLMTMAPFVDDEKTVRSCFSLCREWSGMIKQYCGESPVLSMGMSSDYRWAVAEGSTMLRIGTTLFGGRG